jgi:hypothetical protein
VVDILSVLEYNEKMNTVANNVIKFPSKGNFSQAQAAPNPQELALNVSMVKYNHINEVLETIIPMLFNNMELAGFQIVPQNDEEEDPNIKDGALIVESIRSLMCKYYGMQHPFQDLAESLFNPNQDGSFALTKKLEMDFSTFEEAQTES